VSRTGRKTFVDKRRAQVGLVIPLADEERLGRALGWSEIRERVLEAEEGGFDSLWVWDHLLHRFSGRPTVGFWESWTMLSAIAATTSRVSVGTLVLCSGFRNPALVAKMAVTLDEVSAGRLVLGLGAGWHQPEFDAFGFAFDCRVARFEEALQIIVPLLRDGGVTFLGRHHRARECEIVPPPTRGGPPLMVAATGPRMLDLTARYADLWNTDWLGPSSQLGFRISALHDACRRQGRDPATLLVTGGLTVAYPDLGDVPSWISSPDQFLSGSSEQMATALREYEALGVSHIMCTCYPFNSAAVQRLAEGVRAYVDESNY
jgi:alkanesulfonate monooxygenase SsuD/methylene tetrahydromethanopterin reductase-like flavin-dependent oxidoreductase (luciferase family)